MAQFYELVGALREIRNVSQVSRVWDDGSGDEESMSVVSVS